MTRDVFYAYYRFQIELQTLKKKKRRFTLSPQEITKMDTLRASQRHARSTLDRLIDECVDPQTRDMLKMRFLDFRTWGQIAQAIGGKNTASGCRMRVARYIDHLHDTHEKLAD